MLQEAGERRRKGDGRKEGEGEAGGGDQARLPAGSERRLPAVAMAAARHLQPSGEADRLLRTDSRTAAAGDARPPTSSARVGEPPSWFRGREEPGPTRKRCAAGATLRAGRDGRRL